MGYTTDEADNAITEGKVDTVAFGTGFLANTDLPARIKVGVPLNSPNPANFTSPDRKAISTIRHWVLCDY